MAPRAALLLCAAALVLAASAQGRSLTQAPPPAPTSTGVPRAYPSAAPTDPRSYIQTGTPKECSGGLLQGNQWSGDELECHVCDGNKLQLKCDLDTDLSGDDSAKCELDNAGLGSLINNAYEFDCVLNKGKVPPLQCDWAKLQKNLPGCAAEPVKRIMAIWSPKE